MKERSVCEPKHRGLNHETRTALVLSPELRAWSIGVFRSDPDGTCTFINARGCEIIGLSREKVIGRSWVHEPALSQQSCRKQGHTIDIEGDTTSGEKVWTPGGGNR